MKTTTPRRSRLLSNIAWNYAAGFSSVFGLLLLYPMAVGITGATEYGLWVLAFGAIQLFSMSDFGLGNAIVRLLAAIPNDAAHHRQRQGFVGVSLLLFATLATVLSAIFALAFPIYLRSVPQAAAVGHLDVLVPLTTVTLFVSVMGRAMNSILWADDRPDIERKASLISMAVRVLGYLGVLTNGAGLLGVMLVEAGTLMIPPLVCAAAVFRRHGVPWIERETFAVRAKELLSLSGVLFIGTFSLLIAFHLPLYVIGATHGLAAVTAFGAIMRVYQSARLLLSWTANPFIHWISTVQRSGVGAVLHRCLALSLLLTVLIGVPIALLGDEILRVWMGKEFVFAGAAFAALSLGILADAIIQPSSLVVNLRGNPWLISWANLGLLMIGAPVLIMTANTGNLLATTLAMVLPPLIGAPLYLWWAQRTAGHSSGCPRAQVLLVPLIAGAGCAAASMVGTGWIPLIVAALVQLAVLATVVLRTRGWFFATSDAGEHTADASGHSVIRDAG